MSKHTPGPWRCQHTGTHWAIEQAESPWLQVATASNDTMSAVYNARLIAAAPELLEVAQMFFEWHANHFEDFSDEVNMQVLCIANAAEPAIAKAEGRE